MAGIAVLMVLDLAEMSQIIGDWLESRHCRTRYIGMLTLRSNIVASFDTAQCARFDLNEKPCLLVMLAVPTAAVFPKTKRRLR